MSRTLLQLFQGCCFALTFWPQCGLQAFDEAKSQKRIACVEQTRISGLLFAPMKVGSTEGVALVDTGSDVCAIDTRFYEESGMQFLHTAKPFTVVFPDGVTTQSVAGNEVLSIADDPATPLKLVSLDLRTPFTGTGWKCECVAAVNLLERSPFRIRGGVAFERIRDDALPINLEPQKIWSAKESGLQMEVNLGHRPLTITIDTGSMAAMSLSQLWINRLMETGAIVACPDLDRPIYQPDGRLVVTKAYWVREIQVGSVTFSNVFVYALGKNILGMPILRHFDMTVDMKGGRLWLDPLPSAKTATWAPGGTGFNFWFEQDGRMMVLENMRPGGPAEVAGIKPGDEILEIDGKPVTDFTFYTATDRFSEAGTTLHLKYRRNDMNFETSMVLKHRVPFPPVWPDDGRNVTEEVDDSKPNVGPKK